MREDPTIRHVKGPFSVDDESKWKAFLQQQPHGSFFQSPDYLSLFENCRNYQPVVLFAENAKGEMVGLLVATIIRDHIYGLPFQHMLVQGGPVILKSIQRKAPVLRALLKALKRHIPVRNVFLEIRNLQHWGDDAVAFQESGFTWHDHLNDILPIHSRNQVFSAIKPAKQRQIRRGIENGALIRPVANAAEVEAFYHLLHELYKKKVRKPLAPLKFFQNFYQKIQMEKKGVILVVFYKEKVIGGMVCPFSSQHTVHEWYICSMQSRLKHLYPGVLATWAGIDFATQNRFKAFDFMGIGTPQKPYGVRNFKTQFGGEVVNFGRWQLINSKFWYQLGLWGYSVLKRFSRR